MRNYTYFRQDSGAGSGTTPPPPPPPPQFNAPPPPPPPAQNYQTHGTQNTGGSASSNSIIVLVLGILSWILCGIFTAIPAWIMGKKEIRDIDEGRSPIAGRTMAVIGMWLGIIQVILWILMILLVIVLLALGLLGGIIDSMNY